jgi:hypothetical protein
LSLPVNWRADDIASKAQFERQFKKWKFRKYLNDKEWEYVQHRSVKRKRDDGKESEVHINGSLISAKKIKKEVSRRFPPTFEKSHASGKCSTHP